MIQGDNTLLARCFMENFGKNSDKKCDRLVFINKRPPPRLSGV